MQIQPGVFIYAVRLRLPGGLEENAGTFSTGRRRVVRDVVNLPKGPDGRGHSGKGYLWRVAAIQEHSEPLIENVLVLEFERPHSEVAEVTAEQMP